MAGTFIFLPQEGGGSGAVDSVNGQTGVVILDTDDIPEGVTNLYYTDAQARAALSATSPLLYNSGTGDFSIQVATALQNGYLSFADWTTFNNKEPAISAGTTADYYRGDKTFQTLNVAALQIITDGSSAGTAVNQIVTAQQTTATATGVGATGVYGNSISVSVPAGRWILWGTAGFSENGAVLTTAMQCGISDSATGVGLTNVNTSIFPALISSTSDLILTPPQSVISISSTTTYYMNTKFYYTAGSPQHYGKISALRIG
jgi:hypothetical protein